MPFLIVIYILANIGFSYLNGNIALFVMLLVSLFLIYKSYNTSLLKITQQKLLICYIVFILYIWHYRDNNILGYVSTIIQVLSISIVVCLNRELLLKVIGLYIRVFSWISGISLFFWVLYLLGIYNISLGTIAFSGVYEFDNYIFFFLKQGDNLWARFQCLFDEPGTYSLLCIITLLLNRFKRDKYSAILLVSILFTLSLAGYLILIFILFYKYIIETKGGLLKLVPFLFCFGIYWMGVNYNGGDNILNSAILFRLQLNDDNEISGYNRRTKDFDYFYENQVKGEVWLMGIGGKRYKEKHFENSVDYKGYIAYDGVIGLVFFILLYLLILKSYAITKDTILIFMVFVIIFLRGFVFSFSPGSMILLNMAMFYLSNESGYITYNNQSQYAFKGENTI